MTSTIESRLSAALKAVAATVPDDPPAAWADAAPPRRPRPRWSTAGRHPSWGRLAGVVALSMTAAGAGVGVAAAAGAFTTDVGPAKGLATSSHRAPGEVTRVVAAGPGGSTLEVVSASSNSHSGCMELVVTDPRDATSPTTHEPGACGSLSNAAIPPSQTHLTSNGTLQARTTWKSPTGTLYAVLYGQAPSGAVSVDVANSSGTPAIPATATQRGWFVVAVPAGVFRSSSLVFYGSTGRVVTRSVPAGM